MENTNAYIHLNMNYIVNITHVSISTYSDDASTAPSAATITGIDTADIVSSPGTRFNILASFPMAIDEKLSVDNGFSDYELVSVFTYNTVISVIKSSFTIENISSRSYFSVAQSFWDAFICPLFVGDRQVTILNSDFMTSSWALQAPADFNLKVENVSVDFSYTYGGFFGAVHH